MLEGFLWRLHLMSIISKILVILPSYFQCNFFGEKTFLIQRNSGIVECCGLVLWKPFLTPILIFLKLSLKLFLTALELDVFWHSSPVFSSLYSTKHIWLFITVQKIKKKHAGRQHNIDAISDKYFSFLFYMPLRSFVLLYCWPI